MINPEILRTQVRELLDRGEDVYVTFDPRDVAVAVPTSLKSRAHAVLRFLKSEVRELVVGPQGLSGTLLFNRRDVWVYVPWRAVSDIETNTLKVLSKRAKKVPYLRLVE